jgi:hypothetical protein
MTTLQVLAAIKVKDVALATFNHSVLLLKIEDAISSSDSRPTLEVAYVKSAATKAGRRRQARAGRERRAIRQDDTLEVGWRVVGLETNLQVGNRELSPSRIPLYMDARARVGGTDVHAALDRQCAPSRCFSCPWRGVHLKG